MTKRLHIFIDGSWLFKIGGAHKLLASKTDRPAKPFSMNFDKLNAALLGHIQRQDPDCAELGHLYYVTSIFDIPPDVDSWPMMGEVTYDQVETVKKNVFARTMVASNAVRAGYGEDTIYRPPLRSFVVRKLADMEYHEKRVDASVSALLVRSALVDPQDYHVVITGDIDVLSVIDFVYPHYSENIFIATTHPEEFSQDHRNAPNLVSTLDLKLETFYLQDYIADLIHGNFAYHCVDCNRVFTRLNPIPSRSRPCCSMCRPMVNYA